MPNRVWQRNPDGIAAIKYFVQFIGLHDGENLERVSMDLHQHFMSCGTEGGFRYRYRYVIFAWRPDKHWSKEGVTYVSFEDVVRFMTEQRGACRGEDACSLHPQWDSDIKTLFAIANSRGPDGLQAAQRVRLVCKILEQSKDNEQQTASSSRGCVAAPVIAPEVASVPDECVEATGPGRKRCTEN